MRRYCVPAAGILFLTRVLLAQEPPARAVYASAGETAVFADEVEWRVRGELARRTSVPESSREGLARYLRQKIGGELLDEACLVEAARLRGIEPAPSAIEERLAALRAERGGEAAWHEWLAREGRTGEHERERVRRGLSVEMLRASVADPSEAEVANYFQQRIDEFTQLERVTARHILLRPAPRESKAQREERRQRLEAIRARAAAGESFADLAREHSQDEGTAAKGGALGSFLRGDMVKPFEDAAFALKPGEVSGVVESDFGFHLILCEDRVEAREASLAEARGRIVAALRAEAAARLVKQILADCRPRLSDTSPLPRQVSH